MNKREAVLELLDPGAKQRFIPAAFFLHFDREFHSGAAAVEKHKEFFRFTGMDIVKVQFEVDFPHLEDWAGVPMIDFRPQIEVVRGLVRELGNEALVVLTLYSPFMIAAQMAGPDRLNRDLEVDMPAVEPALRAITDQLLGFVRNCVAVGLDGFYHSTQGAEKGRFSDPSVFDRGVRPYDLEVMGEIERTCRFNILHICDYHRETYGGYDDLTRFADYPGHIVNCNPEGRGFEEVSRIFARPFMGGMDRKGALASGSAEEARQAARHAIENKSRRFFLAADCTVPPDTPWENLRAAVDEAHLWGKD
jgi:uroporphyrinogen decarboxylase